MRTTSLSRISSQWKDHSDQIKQLIALGSSDQKILEQARSYIHNLDFQKCIGELEDVIELTFLLPKVNYPNNTQLQQFIQKYVAKTEEFSHVHVKNITALLILSPESFLVVFDTFFGVEDFLDKFQPVLQEMELDDVIMFSNAVSKSVSDFSEPKMHAFLKVIASAFLPTIDRSKPLNALTALLGCEFPIWKMIRTLPRKVEALYKTINPSEALGLMLALNRQKKNHREWGIVLQQLICRSSEKYSPLDFINIFVIAAELRIPIRENLWKEISRYAVNPIGDQSYIESLCRSLQMLRNSTDPACKTFRHKVVQLLEDKIKIFVAGRDGKLSESNVSYLLCYGYLNKEKAKKLFSSLSNEKPEITSQTQLKLCKLMYIVGVYPKKLILDLSTSTGKHSQEHGIFLLNAVFNAGLPVQETILQQAVGFFAYRQFSSRKGARTDMLASNNGLVLLRVLSHLNVEKYGEKYFPISSILQMCSIPMPERLALLSASVTYNKNASISKNFLQDVLSKARLCDQQQLQTVFLSLAALKMREAVVFTKLLRIAEEREPTVGLALCVAKAAHSLKLTPQFSRTTLIQSIKRLNDTSFESFLELIKYSTKYQRKYLVLLPDGQRQLENADVQKITTGSLFILSNVSSPGERKRYIKLLESREPMKAGAVSSEEVVLNLEDARLCEEAEIILKIGGNCLDEVDERQLMRILRCLENLSECPNIAFRILGRSIIKNIKSMTADEALSWLNLYVKYEIRDDAVSKVLLKKAQSRRLWVSKDLETQMRKAEIFFGVTNVRGAIRKERNTAYYSTTL